MLNIGIVQENEFFIEEEQERLEIVAVGGLDKKLAFLILDYREASIGS